jgi:putative transposase
VHALIRRDRRERGGAVVNVKRIYRIMKAQGFLLERHTGNGAEQRHGGRVAVDRPDTRWCLDGLEIGCENGQRVITLDCCVTSRSPGWERRAPLGAGKAVAGAD